MIAVVISPPHAPLADHLSHVLTRTVVPFVAFGKEMSHIHRFLEAKLPRIEEEIRQHSDVPTSPSTPKSDRPAAPTTRRNSTINSAPLIPRKSSGPELKKSRDSVDNGAHPSAMRVRSDSSSVRKSLRATQRSLLKDSETVAPTTMADSRDMSQHVQTLIQLKHVVTKISALVQTL